MESLNTPQTIFCVFYAIFWGLVANAQIRWKAFDWPLALAGRNDNTYKPSWNRIKQSIVYLMILPVILFVLAMVLLSSGPSSVPSRELDWHYFIKIAGAVIAAHAAFAPYRLWLASVESEPGKYFYVLATGGYATQPDPANEPLHLDPKWSCYNYCVACCYFVVSALSAVLTRLFG
jgi:hypothetical protein